MSRRGNLSRVLGESHGYFFSLFEGVNTVLVVRGSLDLDSRVHNVILSFSTIYIILALIYTLLL